MTNRENHRRKAQVDEPTALGRRDPAVIDRVLSALDPVLQAWFRPVVRGLDRLPEGRALVVANHNGGILMPDLFVMACAWRRERGTDDLPYALGHDRAMRVPHLGPFLEALGGVRATPAAAHEVFRAGHKVLVFPGGDLECFRPFHQRDRIVFGPHRGYVRLAIREGVPIAPMVTAGGHSTFIVLDDGKKLASLLGLRKMRVNVCPTVVSVPWGVTVGFPPPYVPLPTQMWVEALEPIHFTRRGEEAAADEAYVEACHTQVVGRMQAALDRLSRERRETRRDEIADAAWRAVEWLDRKLSSKHHEPLAPAAEVVPLHTTEAAAVADGPSTGTMRRAEGAGTRAA